MWKHCCHVLCKLTVRDILVFHAVDTNLYLYFLCNMLMFIVFLGRSLMRSRQDEVNKIIEISDVGIYCHELEEQQDPCNVGALGNGHSRDDHLVNPFSVTVSVLVSALFPQHVSININTVISLVFPKGFQSFLNTLIFAQLLFFLLNVTSLINSIMSSL